MDVLEGCVLFGTAELEKEDGMPTIKALVVERRQLRGRSDDDNSVKELVFQYLKNVCKFLPNETLEGREFASLMAEFVDHHKVVCDDSAFSNTIKKLTEKAMDERDDLRDYMELRQKLIEEICRR